MEAVVSQLSNWDKVVVQICSDAKFIIYGVEKLKATANM